MNYGVAEYYAVHYDVAENEKAVHFTVQYRRCMAQLQIVEG